MRILTTVLEISRSEALTGRKQFAWFDVGELAAELAEMYDPLADEREATLEYDRPARPVPLFGHRQLLAQAITIWSRMRSATAPAAVRSRSRKARRTTDPDRGGRPRARHSVRPPSEARRRFGRLDSSRSDEGAGLGLALAEAIAHLHQGKLMLEDNEPGLLTVLELPVHSQQPRAA